MAFKFENNFLIGYEFTNNLGPSSKWLRDINTDLYRKILAEAKRFQPTDKDAHLKVELQCESFMSIQDPMDNMYIKQHSTDYGNVNFYNLRAAHYERSISMKEFLKMNKGRYPKIGKNEFQVKSFAYTFDRHKVLSEVAKVLIMNKL